MNFLAHIYLARPTPESVIGNVIADLVKGPAVAALPQAVRDGVMMHRHVDAFTDRHPRVQRSISRISANWGWFSGIILDVHYDHILARDWHRYSDEPLRSFADRAYATLRGAKAFLGDEACVFLDRFIGDDRLVRYASIDGLADTLLHVSRRIAKRMPTRALPLADAVPELQSLDAELTEDFRAFFPELVRYVGELG